MYVTYSSAHHEIKQNSHFWMGTILETGFWEDGKVKPISLTSLRNQLFKVVDEAIRTGIPVEIERKGHRLQIVPEKKKNILENIKPHDCIVGSPDDLVDLKVAPWQEEKNL